MFPGNFPVTFLCIRVSASTKPWRMLAAVYQYSEVLSARVVLGKYKSRFNLNCD